MIDVVFLLLIFFMVTTTFSQMEVDRKIVLPPASSAKPDRRGPKVVLVNVRENGVVRVENRAYGIDQLAGLFRQIAAQNRDRVIVVRGDERAYHEYFVGVLKACADAKLEKVRVAVRQTALRAP